MPVLLLGRDLTYVETGFIEIGENGIITRAGAGNYNSKTLNNNISSSSDGNRTVLDSEGLLVMPGFINAHTHVGDSIGKDVLVESGGLNTRIHPILWCQESYSPKKQSRSPEDAHEGFHNIHDEKRYCCLFRL